MMTMDERIKVNTADFAIGVSPQILLTVGVGSCVAVCLYEKTRKIGALMHIMLPAYLGMSAIQPSQVSMIGQGQLNPLRFADTALGFAIEELAKRGVVKETLTAKLVGGAQMFAAFGPENDVGARNVEEIERILSIFGIPIVGRDIRGSIGRSLEFDLDTGLIKISTKVR